MRELILGAIEYDYETEDGEVIPLEIGYQFQKGTTVNRGDDPDDLQVNSCRRLDIKARDYWDNLPRQTQELLIERCTDDALGQLD